MQLQILQQKAKEITAAVERVSEEMLHIAPWRTEEVPRIIEHCLQTKTPLVVGNGPLTAGARFSLSKLQKIKPDQESLIVHAEAGITFEQLEAKLHDFQLTLGSFPGELKTHTVGGAIAGRSYWKLGRYFSYWEDPLLALEAILPNGNFYRTTPSPRKATGPDLMRLIAGSEGSIGIVMSAKLRVYHQSRSAREAAWKFASLQEAGIAARRLLRDGLCCAVVFAKEHASYSTLAARWEGSMAALQQERLYSAEETLGPTSYDPSELLRSYTAAKPSEAKPVAEILLPYEKVNALLSQFPTRTGATLTAKLPELALLAIDGIAPSALFAIAKEFEGFPSPCSALYEEGATFGARTLGAAFDSLCAMKKNLDTENLFAPNALGLTGR